MQRHCDTFVGLKLLARTYSTLGGTEQMALSCSCWCEICQKRLRQWKAPESYTRGSCPAHSSCDVRIIHFRIPVTWFNLFYYACRTPSSNACFCTFKSNNQGPCPACGMDTGSYLLISMLSNKAKTLLWSFIWNPLVLAVASLAPNLQWSPRNSAYTSCCCSISPWTESLDYSQSFRTKGFMHTHMLHTHTNFSSWNNKSYQHLSPSILRTRDAGKEARTSGKNIKGNLWTTKKPKGKLRTTWILFFFSPLLTSFISLSIINLKQMEKMERKAMWKIQMVACLKYNQHNLSRNRKKNA